MSAGKLVLCPTPVGNLEDVTLRVLRALRESDVIFAEDTRVTATLLRRYEVHTPMRSYPESARASRLRALRALMNDGKVVAMVTDAGMPGISDPGSELVREACACGETVEVLPGPSALLAALVLSGFDVSAFRFDGFPPRKAGERRAYLARLEEERLPVVWYEAPTRVLELLEDVARIFPERRVFVLREYTKKFEQHVWGLAADVMRELSSPARGEFTLVLEGGSGTLRRTDDAKSAIAFLIARGISAKDATEAVRKATGLPKNELYRLALKARANENATD